MARPESARSAEWIDAQLGKSWRCLDMFEREAAGESPSNEADAVDIGDVALGCALGWLDFRMPDENWRGTRPALAGWFKAMSQRRSMQMTLPANPTV
jgi:glutathione S-transferase